MTDHEMTLIERKPRCVSTLWGGAGKDLFVMKATDASGMRIRDFDVRYDDLWILDRSGYAIDFTAQREGSS